MDDKEIILEYIKEAGWPAGVRLHDIWFVMSRQYSIERPRTEEVVNELLLDGDIYVNGDRYRVVRRRAQRIAETMPPIAAGKVIITNDKWREYKVGLIVGVILVIVGAIVAAISHHFGYT